MIALIKRGIQLGTDIRPNISLRLLLVLSAAIKSLKTLNNGLILK